MVEIGAPPLHKTGGVVEGQVIHIDAFGNLITSLPAELIGTITGDPQARAAEVAIEVEGTGGQVQPGVRPHVLGRAVGRADRVHRLGRPARDRAPRRFGRQAHRRGPRRDRAGRQSPARGRRLPVRVFEFDARRRLSGEQRHELHVVRVRGAARPFGANSRTSGLNLCPAPSAWPSSSSAAHVWPKRTSWAAAACSSAGGPAAPRSPPPGPATMQNPLREPPNISQRRDDQASPRTSRPASRRSGASAARCRRPAPRRSGNAAPAAPSWVASTRTSPRNTDPSAESLRPVGAGRGR